MARRLSGTVQAGLERIHLSRGRDSSPGRQRHGSGDGAESLQASGNKRLVSVGWPKGSVKGDEARLAIGVVSYDQPRHFLLHAQDGTPLTVDLELNGKVVASGALSGVPAVRAVPAAAQAPCTRRARAHPQPPSAFRRPRCPRHAPAEAADRCALPPLPPLYYGSPYYGSRAPRPTRCSSRRSGCGWRLSTRSTPLWRSPRTARPRHPSPRASRASPPRPRRHCPR